MKLSLKERKLVKEYAKKLAEGSFSVNAYNFKPGVPIKKIDDSFANTIKLMESLLNDVKSNMTTKSLAYKMFDSILTKLYNIKEDVVDIYAKYEKEGNGGTYLSPVTDPDMLAKISNYNKGK